MKGRCPFEIKNEMNLPRSQHPKPCAWRPDQQVKFVVFIEFFPEQFRTCSFQTPKPWAFWRKLAIFIQTKNPNQCRIFRKKLLTSFSTVQSISSHLKKNIDRFEQLYSFYSNMLKTTFKALNSENKRAIPISQHFEGHIESLQQTKMQLQADPSKHQDLNERSTFLSKEAGRKQRICQSNDKTDLTSMYSKQDIEPIRLNNSTKTKTHLQETQNNIRQDILVGQAIECHRNFLQYIDFLRLLPTHNNGSS